MDTKEKIIKVSSKIFAKLGFSGVRIDALVKEIGINKATFYYHFKSKKEIFEVIVTENVQKLQNEIDKKLSACKTPEEKIKGFIDVMFERDRLNVLLIIREIIDGGDNLSDEIILLMSSIKDRLCKILKEGKQQGKFINDDAIFIMYLILGVSDFFIISDPFAQKFNNIQKEHFPIDERKFIEKFKNTVINAIIAVFENNNTTLAQKEITCKF